MFIVIGIILIKNRIIILNELHYKLKGRYMGYVYLAMAIISKVIGTSMLKEADGFTKTVPSFIVVIGYGISFYFMSLTLKTIPIGITYAIWSGSGIVLIAVIGALLYRQIPDISAVIGYV